jgi:hypothetical protein
MYKTLILGACLTALLTGCPRAQEVKGPEPRDPEREQQKDATEVNRAQDRSDQSRREDRQQLQQEKPVQTPKTP